MDGEQQQRRSAGSNGEGLHEEDNPVELEILPPGPLPGDSLIVMKEPFTSMVLDGTKTLELRRQAIDQNYYLADSTTKTVVGLIAFGDSYTLDTDTFRMTRDRHRHTEANMPYARTVATEILHVWPWRLPVPYKFSRSSAFGFQLFEYP